MKRSTQDYKLYLDDIADSANWDIVKNKLPELKKVANELLKED